MSLPPPRHDRLVSHLLRDQAAERPDKEALAYPAFTQNGTAVRLNFSQLDAEVDRLARGLIALGIRKGEHVAVWAGNVSSWIPLEFALARVGAVLVTVNTSLQPDEVAYILSQSHAVAVIHTTCNGSTQASATLDNLLAAETTGQPSSTSDHPVLPDRLRLRIWLPSLADEAPPSMRAPRTGEAVTVQQLYERGNKVSLDEVRLRENSLDSGDVINIQYTSGTTGFPKGVMLSHVNMMTSAYALGDELELTPEDRVVLMVPLFHCFGCVVAVLGTFTYGASLHALPAFEPGDALRLIHEERCTVIHGVPTMYSAMIAHDDLKKYDTSSLRTGLAAGAPCPVPLMAAIRDELKCEGILVAFGLTEAAPGVSGCRPGDTFEARSETIGRPIYAVEMRIADPATLEPVPDGTEGEIQVRGPNVMVGYHNDPQATAASMTPDGWLKTGDLGTCGPDGLFRVVGRIKNIIIRGGENIAPAEIENLLRAHPDILDAAVVGIRDEKFGEEVAAALRLSPGKSVDIDSYKAALEGRIGSFKQPKTFHVFEAFPLTGSGKVKKFLLSKWIEGELGIHSEEPAQR
ncbi:MAG: AMP-binding protein [Planctomycetota bacterium]|nr:AMP-binding protein [Planctomycetota bacterium]